MKTVYSPDNNIEGHMLVDLLARSGIEAELLGKHLRGGLGELPMAGNLHVAVFDVDDAEEARKIIKEWEATPYADETVATQSSGSGWFSGFVGVFLGAGLASAFFVGNKYSASYDDEKDYNRDGIVDEYIYWDWSGDFLEQIDGDRNADGEIDVRYFYKKGVWEGSKSDDDFDGSFETETLAKHGETYAYLADRSGNGAVDYRYYHVHGVLERGEIYSPRTGMLRKTEHYQDGWLMEARWDSDEDGELDTLITYDFYGEELTRKPLSE